MFGAVGILIDRGPDFLRYVCDMQQKKNTNKQTNNLKSLSVVAGKDSKVGGAVLLGVA